ncbi:MAG: tRNA lysidine(34) synthetase TilS, partial [Armatimonadetes bacterium]|nr:tRNA lysidine(34) synthetase TilS [Armatimonadota bacterium]
GTPTPPHPHTPTLLVVRPLIEVWRHEVEAYCRARGLAPREDASNLSREFLRNHVRLDLLPYLEEHFGIAVKPSLQRLSWIVRPEVEFLEETAAAALDRLAEPVEAGLTLPAEAIGQLALAIRRRVVRAALRRVKGEPTEIGFQDIERVLEAATGEAETSFDLPGPVRVQRRADRLRLFRPAAAPVSPRSWRTRPLFLPGEAEAPGGGMITAEAMDQPGGFDPPRVPRAREVFIDADRVDPILFVRGWVRGDRFVPLGMSGGKSLHDLFVDEKIPRVARDRVPVVADSSGIVWVAGVQIADRVKVTDQTRRLLRLRWEEEGEGEP